MQDTAEHPRNTAELALTEFLLARIAERESLARDMRHQAAAGRPFVDPELLAGGTLLRDLIDPARVLGECEAKRRIVALHHLSEGPNYRGTECCARCTAAGEYPADDGYTDEQNWPCPTLRALALPYADHPDYREKWRL